MPNYGRDLDIGRPTIGNLTENVEVQNLEGVIASINDTNAKMEEAIAELNKIKVGTGLNISVDLDEEVE